MTLKIKVPSLKINKDASTFVFLTLLYVLFFGFARDVVGLPSAISYLLDALNIFLLFAAAVKRRILCFESPYYKTAFFFIAVFVLLTLFGVVISEGSMLLYLWGFRNTVRFFVFFLACGTLLRADDVSGVVTFIKFAFGINAVFATLEFLMGKSGDYLGGTFGVEKGCNSFINMLLVIYTAVCVAEYLEKKRGLLRLVIAIGLCLYIMAIAELKVYIFELPMIVILSMAISGRSVRKIIIAALALFGITVGILFLDYFFKESSGSNFFTPERLAVYLGDRGYTNSGDLNRFNAIPELYKRFFKGDIVKSLFGYGLGNCGYSNINTFVSDFYRHYNEMHYQWFTDAMIFAETGILGTFFYGIFFIASFFNGLAVKKRYTVPKTKESVAVISASVTAIMLISVAVYDNSLLVEASYMAAAVLAVPIAISRTPEYLPQDKGGIYEQ